MESQCRHSVLDLNPNRYGWWAHVDMWGDADFKKSLLSVISYSTTVSLTLPLRLVYLLYQRESIFLLQERVSTVAPFVWLPEDSSCGEKGPFCVGSAVADTYLISCPVKNHTGIVCWASEPLQYIDLIMQHMFIAFCLFVGIIGVFCGHFQFLC